MSELLRLCATLRSIDRDIAGVAAELQDHARAYSRAAEYAAAALRQDDPGRAAAIRAVEALSAAAKATAWASTLLARAAVQGDAFVARHMGTAPPFTGALGPAAAPPLDGTSAKAVLARALLTSMTSDEVREGVLIPLAAELVDQLIEKAAGLGGASQAFDSAVASADAWLHGGGPEVLRARAAQLYARAISGFHRSNGSGGVSEDEPHDG